MIYDRKNIGKVFNEDLSLFYVIKLFRFSSTLRSFLETKMETNIGLY
jgi:hypothetical protein